MNFRGIGSENLSDAQRSVRDPKAKPVTFSSRCLAAMPKGVFNFLEDNLSPSQLNGLENLFKGNLNMVRNANMQKALFGEDLLKNHHGAFHCGKPSLGRAYSPSRDASTCTTVSLANYPSKGFQRQSLFVQFIDV